MNSLILVQLFGFLLSAFALSYDEALKLTSKDGLLHITEKNYPKLIKNENFSLIVFLTAEDPRVGCTLCSEFGPKYKAIAKQYTNNLNNEESGMYNPIDSPDDKAKVIFAYSDFLKARPYFEALKLTAVPRLLYYEPGKGPQLDVFTNEFSFLAVENTDSYSRWVAQVIPLLEAKYLDAQPQAGKSMMLTSIIILIATLGVIFQFRKTVLKVVQNKNVWQFLSLVLIILFISGHMYNQIRNPDASKTDKNGKVHYIAVGHNLQYSFETQAITVIYGLISAFLILLIRMIPTMDKPKMKLAASIICCIGTFILYSYIIEIYRLKSPSYPFHLWSVL